MPVKKWQQLAEQKPELNKQTEEIQQKFRKKVLITLWMNLM